MAARRELNGGSEDCLYILLTGSNSGLGLSICLRLIDEFVATRHSTQSLHLIITTRDTTKSKDTVAKLSQHLSRNSTNLQQDVRNRISFQPEQLELTSLRSVLTLSEKLSHNLPRLDVIILNAGYGGLIGVNWPEAIWKILTDFPSSVTYPTYAISGVGYTTKRQILQVNEEEPALGQIFCSNIFGHYMLISYLAPLLNRARPATTKDTAARSGRVIWISSLEAYANTFSPEDIQGLKTTSAYKSSKRLTDILALTSSLPSSKGEANKWLQTSTSEPSRPNIYLTHPGICATSFVPLNIIMYYAMTLVMYLARWLGSKWHTVSSYKGAYAPVWLALAPQEELNAFEADGAGKWGSCVDVAGNERATRTEVEGWGIRGKVEPLIQEYRKWRRKGVRDVTKEQRDDFEQLGRDCWAQMNRLNEDWRRRMEMAETKMGSKS